VTLILLIAAAAGLATAAFGSARLALRVVTADHGSMPSRADALDVYNPAGTPATIRARAGVD
jgi:hypothetical protein